MYWLDENSMVVKFWDKKVDQPNYLDDWRLSRSFYGTNNPCRHVKRHFKHNLFYKTF